MTNNPEEFPRSNMPDFMQVFDGSQPMLSPEEQAEAGRQFGDLVDDVMLAHIVEVQDTSISSRNWPQNKLILVKPDKLGYWKSQLTSRQLDDEFTSLPSKMLSLTYFDQDGREREEFMYRLDSDGVVRRENMGDFEQIPGSAESMMGAGEQDDMVDDDAIALMEVEMGINNQPVGVNEIAGLRKMLLLSMKLTN